MEQLKNTGDKFFYEQNYEEANKYYTKALELDSEDKYKIYLNRCLSFYKQEKYNEALSDAIKATRLNPNNAKSWGRLGSCLNVLGRKQQSIRAFKKAYELEPTNKNYKKEAEEKSELNNSDTEDEDNEDTEDENNENNEDNNFQQEILSLTKNLKSINFASIKDIDLLNNKTVDNMLNNMLSNKELINKLSDQSFQNRILSYKNNPFEALKDKETMYLMCSILQDFTEIK